jgi:predicted nucleic acid-binding protein
MQPSRYVYWDSSVFLYYINAHPAHIQAIEAVWTEIADESDARIVTSTISIAEVAYGANELSKGPLDLEVSAEIDNLWRDPSILLVETLAF